MAQLAIRINTRFGSVEATSELSHNNRNNYLDCLEQLSTVKDPDVDRFLHTSLKDNVIRQYLEKAATERWI